MVGGGGGALYVVALLTELLGQVIKYRSVGSAVAFLGQITFFEDRHPSEKRAKFCILNGTLQVFFGTWQDIISKFASHFVPTQIIILL